MMVGWTRRARKSRERTRRWWLSLTEEQRVQHRKDDKEYNRKYGWVFEAAFVIMILGITATFLIWLTTMEGFFK